MTTYKDMRTAFGQYPCGLTIVGANDQGRLNGLAVIGFSIASVEPLMVMVTIAPERFTHSFVKNSGAYAVSVLSEDQLETARLFGLKSGREVDKFKGLDYHLGMTGSPILIGSAGWLDCVVRHVYPAGDHDIFIGEVVDAGFDVQKKTYLYHREDFF